MLSALGTARVRGMEVPVRKVTTTLHGDGVVVRTDPNI